MKVTIYHKSPLGAIVPLEGTLTGVTPHGVDYIPKGGRRERMVMTYYSPYIRVVRGWGKPKGPSGWQKAEQGVTGATTIRRGKYRSQDPRWEQDFESSSAGGGAAVVLFRDGRLVQNDSGLGDSSLKPNGRRGRLGAKRRNPWTVEVRGRRPGSSTTSGIIDPGYSSREAAEASLAEEVERRRRKGYVIERAETFFSKRGAERSNPRRNPVPRRLPQGNQLYAAIRRMHDLTEYNDHAEALVVLARDILRSPRSTKTALRIKKARDQQGYMPHDLSKQSYALMQRLLAQAKRQFPADVYALIHQSL